MRQSLIESVSQSSVRSSGNEDTTQMNSNAADIPFPSGIVLQPTHVPRYSTITNLNYTDFWNMFLDIGDDQWIEPINYLDENAITSNIYS